MKKKTLIQAATILMLIQLTAAYTIYGDNIQNIGSITGNGDFNTTGRVCDGTQCLDSLDIPGQPNIDWSNITTGTPPQLNIDGSNVTSGTIAAARIPWIQPNIDWANITTGTNPLASDVSNLWTNATAQEAAIAALNATALANMGTYLNYTSSCAAGEVYEWGTGCITTPAGGGGSENATNLISDNPILIKPSGDTDNYFSLSSDGTDLTLATTDTSDLIINPSSDYKLYLNEALSTLQYVQHYRNVRGTSKPYFQEFFYPLDDTTTFEFSGGARLDGVDNDNYASLRVYNSSVGGDLRILNAKGSILLMPNKDTDDYLSLSSDGTDLTLATIGGSKLYLSPEGKNVYIGDNADDANALIFVPAATTGYGAIGMYPGGDASPDNWMLLYLGYDNRPGMSLRTEDDADAQFIPYTDDTYNLGDATYGWDDLYVNDIINDGEITLKPSGDTDDYLKFSTVSNDGVITQIGGGKLTITTDAGDLYLSPAGGDIYPVSDNTVDLGGASTLRWKTGFIANAWTVGDLVFNFEDNNYRIIEAEKLTNNKSHGLMYVMGDKAVMWIEPDGKLHTTQEIDTTWDGITGLSFDEDGGVYKDNEVVRYPVIGSGNETYLSPVFVEDGKKEFKGDDKIDKMKKSKPNKKPSTTTTSTTSTTSSTTFSTTTTIPLTIPKTTTTLISIEEGGVEGLDGLSSGTTA